MQRHNQHQNKKTKERRRENDEKRYNTFFSRENNVFRHYLDCIFCIVYRKMAGRNSKRMRQEKTGCGRYRIRLSSVNPRPVNEACNFHVADNTCTGGVRWDGKNITTPVHCVAPLDLMWWWWWWWCHTCSSSKQRKSWCRTSQARNRWKSIQTVSHVTFSTWRAKSSPDFTPL